MISDRQLLEDAALAVGFHYNPSMSSDDGLFGCFDSDECQSIYKWNPLINNAEALMIADKLKLVIAFNKKFIGVPIKANKLFDLSLCTFEVKMIKDDPCKSMRLAIVGAAAIIGKGMIVSTNE